MNATTMPAHNVLLQDILFGDDKVLKLLGDMDHCAPDTGFCVVIRTDESGVEVFGNSRWNLPADEIDALTSTGPLVRLGDMSSEEMVAVLVDPQDRDGLDGQQNATLAAIGLDLVSKLSSSLRARAINNSFDFNSLRQALGGQREKDCVA